LVYSIKYRNDLPRGMADQMRRSLIPVVWINLALTFAIPVIDKYAHLGGLMAGAILASMAESPAASPERRHREGLPMPAALLTAVGLLMYGAWGLATALPRALPYRSASLAAEHKDPNRAIRILQAIVRRHPDDAAARQLLIDLLTTAGQAQRA